MAQLILPLARPQKRRRLTARGHEEPPRARQPAGEAAAVGGQAGGSPAGRAFVVLIVDDDPLMTDMLPRRLRRVVRPDVEIRTAATPDEARQMILDGAPDAIISDYNLRHVQNGLDVLREAERVAPHAARILFSGHAAREIRGLGDAPIHAYLEKPMRLDELIAPVLDAIQQATGKDLRGGGPRG